MRAGSRWKRFRRRLRYWLDHSERQRLLWEEMEFHIESMTQEFAAQGMSGQEARAAAHRKFGNMTQKSEEARSTWIARWMSDLTQDLRHSFRGMRRDAGFTAFTILIAGLGIGASSTVFSVVECAAAAPAPVSRSRTAGMDYQRRRLYVHPNRTLCGPPGIEPIVLRSGGLVRVLPRGRQRTDGNRRARASHQRSGDWELLRTAGCAAGDRKIVHHRGVPGEVFRSAGHAVELQLLAAAVCFRPQRGGPEADAEQSAGDRGGRTACILRFRERLCSRHAGGYFCSLAAE